MFFLRAAKTYSDDDTDTIQFLFMVAKFFFSYLLFGPKMKELFIRDVRGRAFSSRAGRRRKSAGRVKKRVNQQIKKFDESA